MRILVTGVAGFIGSHLAKALLEQGHEVVGVDNFLTGKKEHLPINDKFTFIECNVNKKEQVRKFFVQFTFDYVYHYAAVVGVRRTLEHPLEVLQDIHGIRYLLWFSKEQGVKRVLFSSSSEVYGESTHFPQHEEHTPLNARLPYAVVKSVGEAYFHSYAQSYGIDYTIFRFFNTYGQGQSEDFVVSRFVKQALSGQDITVLGDGNQKLTFCFVADNVEATINALTSEGAKNQIINIGSEDEMSMIELARKIKEVTHSSSSIIHLPALREGDMLRRKPDISRMRTCLFNKDLTSFEEGLSQLINSMKKGM